MRDYSVDTTFTRAQMEEMPVILRGLVLSEHAAPDGKPMTVDVLQAPLFWVQYSRDHSVYRCADRRRGLPTPYPRDWRLLDD
jgi:hypothetical protein